MEFIYFSAQYIYWKMIYEMIYEMIYKMIYSI